MKRLLITISAMCFLMADPVPHGNWKLSGLAVDYLHITREEAVVTLNDAYGYGISVPVQVFLQVFCSKDLQTDHSLCQLLMQLD